MIAGTVLRGNQQHEHVDRFTIEAVERHPSPRNGHGANEAIGRGMFAVRNGDRSTDAGGAQLFAFENRPDNVFQFAALEVAGLRRLSTISRMTDSLVVAFRSGMMASRTTKSDMRIREPPSLVARFIGGRSPRHLAPGRRAAMVLDFFLVTA